MSSTRIYSVTRFCLTLMAASLVHAATPVLEFGGDDSYVDLGTPAALQIADDAPFTVEGWMYLRSFSDRDTLYSKSAARPDVGPYTYIFGFRDGDLAAYDGGSWRGDIDVSLQTDRWYHLAFSFDGTQMRYYLDGELVGQSDFSFSNAEAHPVVIGGFHSSSDIDGYKSDVRVWDHARDADEIGDFMHYRLTGEDSGLLGYWPMDEGAGTQVFDATVNATIGTIHNANWTTTTDLILYDAGYALAPAFALADLETGSARFTNSNEVELVDFVIPDGGYDHFQITEDGDPNELGGDWIFTNAVPATVKFIQPAADAEVTLYAWFTNTTESVTLRRSQGAIVYTEALPDVSVIPSITRETEGFSIRIAGADLDAGSTGGTAEGESMDIIAMEALWDGGDAPDLTPDDPFVTLTNAGVYSIKLRVVNEAGNVAESSTASTVTLQAPAKPLPMGDRYVVAHNLNAEAPHTNWTTAAASIQDAVNATAANNETILVWPGRYTAPTNAVDFESATNVVYLNRPVTLRSVAGAAKTLIDGEGMHRGIAVSYSGNVRFSVDGFTIVNGFASSGGGAHVSTHNFTCEFFNCVFVDNTAIGAGGAIRADQTSSFNYTTLAISNTVFRNNQTLDGWGGAIYVLWTHIQIENSLFENNRVDAATHRSGGAISLDRGNHRFENTVFRNNHASSSGNAGTGGGAFHLDRGTLLMRNCLLTGNSGLNGGGIRVGINGARVELDNCSIVHNGSNSGIWFRHKTPYFHAYNSILYGNSGHDIRIGSHSDPRTIDIRHCLYGSASIGTTENDTVIMSDNLHADPLFVDPADGNFRLQRDSPAINAGMPRDWHDGAVDLDGNRRVDAIYKQVDLGAYEYRYAATILLVR